MSIYFFGGYLGLGLLMLLALYPAVSGVQKRLQGKLDGLSWLRVFGVVVLLWPLVLIFATYQTLMQARMKGAKR